VTKFESSDLFLVRSDMCSGCIALELRLLRVYIRLHTPHVQSTKYRHLAMSRHDVDFSVVPRHVTCSDASLVNSSSLSLVAHPPALIRRLDSEESLVRFAPSHPRSSCSCVSSHNFRPSLRCGPCSANPQSQFRGADLPWGISSFPSGL
jgi:hypothetical protein